MLTDDARYDALATRDPRFDGVFFVGVSTTGIYCRPICPARTPGRSRCTFYETPVQAEAAGHRACFRCRPELAPGNTESTAAVDAVDALVASAAARISEGALNDASVDDLASELGVSARHLRRAIELRLGVSPVALAGSRRLALAKQLLQDTTLPLTEIAFAAGFGSVRRFNAVFAQAMGRPPSALRKEHVRDVPAGELALRLDHRAPYDWAQVLRFLAARAIPGVERVILGPAGSGPAGSGPAGSGPAGSGPAGSGPAGSGPAGRGSYRRIVHAGGITGVIEVRPSAMRDALVLVLTPSLVPVLMPLVARVRRLFDLDARPDVIGRVLARDRVLAPLVAARPGLRVPGAIDGFEAAVRALLGQQVSVAAATTLAGRFAAAFGVPHAGGDGLVVRFPTAAEVARVRIDAIAAIGLPGARAAAVHALASAIADRTLRLDGVRDLDRFVAEVSELPGIGPWTAHYLAMRALHLPDAFPAADLGIRKALDATPREAEARAEAWRPFRSYAVMHLWTSLGGTDVDTDDHDDDAISGRRAAPRRERDRAGRRLSADPGRAAGPGRARSARGARRREPAARARREPARRVLRG